MSAWAVLQHVPFEGPGLIAAQAQARGLALDYRHLYRGDAVPSVDEVAGLIVMGGPMGADAVRAHPHLREEVELLTAAVAADVPVLGVCLGAQLLARALDAEILFGAARELGLGTVVLTPAGERDVVLGPAGREIPVLHWHDDTFTLPPGAELLASSERCVNQAFRIGRAYGLQFHIELDAALATALRAHLAQDVALPAEGMANVARAGTVLLRRFFDCTGRCSAPLDCGRGRRTETSTRAGA